jgi:Polysaccharide deacetylase
MSFPLIRTCIAAAVALTAPVASALAQRTAPATRPVNAAPATKTERTAKPGTPNKLGVIPVLEYHLIGERESRWSRNWQRFANDLELLHARGYRPITVRQLVSKQVDVGPGLTPVVITFDDASPGQFRYIEKGDSLIVDPTSALGVWEAFAKKHPEWRGRGVFCVLPGADQGHAFFGDKGIQGQKTAWRHRKIAHLVRTGHEVCNHTLWHANLSKMSDAVVQEQIARAQLAVDSAVKGYELRTMALPLGMWPRNRGLLSAGKWKDGKTSLEHRYTIDAVLMVAGGPSKSPFDPSFDKMKIPRIQVFGDELERILDQLDKRGLRFFGDGTSSAK